MSMTSLSIIQKWLSFQIKFRCFFITSKILSGLSGYFKGMLFCAQFVWGVGWRRGNGEGEWNAVINRSLSFMIISNWLQLVINNNINFYTFILYTIYLMSAFTILIHLCLILLHILGYLYHLSITYFTTFELQTLFQFHVLFDYKEPVEWG